MSLPLKEYEYRYVIGEVGSQPKTDHFIQRGKCTIAGTQSVMELSGA